MLTHHFQPFVVGIDFSALFHLSQKHYCKRSTEYGVTVAFYFDSDSSTCLRPYQKINSTMACYSQSWHQYDLNSTTELVYWTDYNVSLIADRPMFRPIHYGPFLIYPGFHGILSAVLSVV